MRQNILPVSVMSAFVALRYIPLRYFAVVTKINKKNKAQERVIVLTDLHLYSCTKSDGAIKRCLSLEHVVRVLTCRNRCEVALIVVENGAEYDLLFQTHTPGALDEFVRNMPKNVEVQAFTLSLQSKHNGSDATLRLEKPPGYARDVADAVRWKASSWTSADARAHPITTSAAAPLPVASPPQPAHSPQPVSSAQLSGATTSEAASRASFLVSSSSSAPPAVSTAGTADAQPAPSKESRARSASTAVRRLSVVSRGSEAASEATGVLLPGTPTLRGRGANAQSVDSEDDDDDITQRADEGTDPASPVGVALPRAVPQLSLSRGSIAASSSFHAADANDGDDDDASDEDGDDSSDFVSVSIHPSSVALRTTQTPPSAPANASAVVEAVVVDAPYHEGPPPQSLAAAPQSPLGGMPDWSPARPSDAYLGRSSATLIASPSSPSPSTSYLPTQLSTTRTEKLSSENRHSDPDLIAALLDERSRFASQLLILSELLAVERGNSAALRTIVDQLRHDVERLTLENAVLKRPISEL